MDLDHSIFHFISRSVPPDKMQDEDNNNADDDAKQGPDETQVVSQMGFMRLKVRPGKLMPQQIQNAFQQADDIVEHWHQKSAELFDWSCGDFTHGELQYDDAVPRKLANIPAGEKLLKFTMFPSAGTALCIRPNGDLVEFDIQFVRK